MLIPALERDADGKKMTGEQALAETIEAKRPKE